MSLSTISSYWPKVKAVDCPLAWQLGGWVMVFGLSLIDHSRKRKHPGHALVGADIRELFQSD